MPSSELYLTERMATVLLQQGNAAEAEVAFKKALAQDPENPEMRNGYGLSLLMLGQAHDALQQFDIALVPVAQVVGQRAVAVERGENPRATSFLVDLRCVAALSDGDAAHTPEQAHRKCA